MKNAALGALTALALGILLAGCAQEPDASGGTQTSDARSPATTTVAEKHVDCKKCGSTVDAEGHHHHCTTCIDAKVCAPCLAAVCTDDAHKGMSDEAHTGAHKA